MSTSTEAIPKEISGFFQEVYRKEPEVTSDRRATTYQIEGEGVSITTDKFGGCHVVAKKVTDAEALRHAIENLAKTSKSFDSVWVEAALPISLNAFGAILPTSFEMGGKTSDLIYDLQNKQVKVWRWINADKECSIPPGATHNIGATALIIDEVAQKVLLVETQGRKGQWCLPGGSYDPSQDAAVWTTALREAQEEAGLEMPREGLTPVLMGEMDFPENQFARSINLNIS